MPIAFWFHELQVSFTRKAETKLGSFRKLGDEELRQIKDHRHTETRFFGWRFFKKNQGIL